MSRPHLFSAIGVALIGVLYFGLTCAHHLEPFDSSEFVLNAAQFGIGHPPGQPLYLLITAIAVRVLPISPPLLLSLLSVAITALLAAIALRFSPPRNNREALLSVLLLASAFFLPGVWDLATRPEVYPLTALLLASAVLLITSITHLATTTNLKWAFLLIALSASVNPAMAIACALSLLPSIISLIAQSPSRRSLTKLLTSFAFGLLGLLPYAALPIIGAHPRTALVWGEPLWGQSLLHYLAGRDYRAWHLTLSEFLLNYKSALLWLAAEGMLPFIALGSIGFLLSPLPRSLRITPLLLTALSLSLIALNHPFIPTNPDYDGYLLTPLWLCAGGLLLLARRLMDHSNADSPARGLVLSALIAIALATTGALSGPPITSRVHTDIAERAARIALDNTPPNGILLLESDHLVFPNLYFTEVLHLRPVTVINAGWMSSSWYLRHLAAANPELPPVPASANQEQRIANLIEAAARPVSAETLSLARLASPPGAAFPCLSGIVVRNGGCEEANFASLNTWIKPLSERSRTGSLDERVLAQISLTHATNAWLLGELGIAYEALRAGLKENTRDSLPLTRPDAFSMEYAAAPSLVEATLRARTPLHQPLALATPSILLLRLGDLLSPIDPVAAASCWERASLPESEDALERLKSRLAH